MKKAEEIMNGETDSEMKKDSKLKNFFKRPGNLIVTIISLPILPL